MISLSRGGKYKGKEQGGKDRSAGVWVAKKVSMSYRQLSEWPHAHTADLVDVLATVLAVVVAFCLLQQSR